MAQDFIPGTLAIHECFFPYRKIPYFTGNNSSWIDIPRAASEFSGATLSLVHVNIPHCPCLARINRIPSSCLEKIKKKQPGKHIPIQQAHSFCSTAPGLPQPSFTVFKGSGFWEQRVSHPQRCLCTISLLLPTLKIHLEDFGLILTVLSQLRNPKNC